MRSTIYPAGILILALAPAIEAQEPTRQVAVPSGVITVRVTVAGNVRIGATNLRTQSTGNVRLLASPAGTVPAGGSTTLGGYSRVAESRKEFGSPVLGKVPVLGRGTRNVGYGRSTTVTRGRVFVRTLRDEEYRQTGFRSP